MDIWAGGNETSLAARSKEEATVLPSREKEGGGGGGEVHRIPSDGDDGMGTKIKTHKDPASKINHHKISLNFQTLKISRKHLSLVVFLLAALRDSDTLGYAGTTTILQIVLNTPKNPYLNQATQKRIPESEISNPKKSFDHPGHLKSGLSSSKSCEKNHPS